MPITWEEIKAKIHFPDKNKLSYDLAYFNVDVIEPNDNFTNDQQDEIMQSVRLLFESSEIAREVLSDYFQEHAIFPDHELFILPAAEGTGSRHIGALGALSPYADTIFIDVTDAGQDYLNLTGHLSKFSLGSVVYHEFLHAFDAVNFVSVPPVEKTGRDFTDPNFDHLGTVVSRVNDVREQVLGTLQYSSFPVPVYIINAFLEEGLEGSYSTGPVLRITDDMNNQFVKDYVNKLSDKIDGSYDQAILFLADGAGAIPIFNSEGTFIDGHHSRDLVIALNESNDISTGKGDDVIVGGSGEDFIDAGGDNDRIYGGKDNDFLFGGTGNDNYHIARSGDGIDTITDEDGNGSIYLDESNGSSSVISGLATPVSGSTGTKQLYEIENNNIKFEYDSASKILNIYDWDDRGANDKIIINDFDSGDLHIHLAEAITTILVPDPLPELPTPPDPEPTPPAPDTDGSSDTLLSVQAVNKTIDVGTRIPLLDLFPFNGWVDNDGVDDIVSFAVADRTSGGGFLEASGVQIAAGEVYEFRVTDIINWYFVAGPSAAVDEIGFNIIQANGDYSPRLEPGAIVTTVVPTIPAPDPTPGPDPVPTGGGSNLAVLSFASTSTAASSGGEVEVKYTVKNIGDVASARGKADIVLASTPDLQTSRRVGDDYNIPELDPGEERTYHRTVDVPISGNGNYFFGVDVRSVSLGHNLIESDDTASIPFQIGPGLSGDPDLRPGFGQPDEIFTQGVAETIDFTISTNNNGSPPYDYRVLLSRDDIASFDDVVLIDKTSAGGLGFSGTHRYNDTQITIPNYVPDGVYNLIVQTDPYARISERREDNNSDAEEIVVVSRPADDNELFNFVGSHVVVETDIMEVLQDYKIKSFGYMDSIDDPIGIIENGIHNIIKDKLYLSKDNIFDASDIPFDVNTSISQGREIGQIITSGSTFPIPQWIDSGDYYLFTVFDSDNKFDEDFESDNVTSGTNVTIVNNLTRTVSAGDDTIELIEGNTHTVDILANDTTSISQDMIVLRFEGDFVRSDTPFIGQTQSGLGYSIDRDGTLILDASALNIDLQPGEVRTETFRYDLRAKLDDTSDLGVVTVSIRDPESDTIQVTPNDATVKETDGQIDFTITRSGDRLNTEETLYVSTTEDHGSTNNSDYTSLLKQPVTFGIGEATKVIPVDILSDSTAELDDTFGLIVQTDPNDPTSTFFTSTTFTIQEDLVARNVSPNTKLFPGHTLGEFSNLFAFAALKDDGSVVTWGRPDWGGDSSSIASDLDGTIDVTQVYSTYGAFAALRSDGSVVSWGLGSDGDSSSVASDLDGTIDVTQIFSSRVAFAALRSDGSVVSWGGNFLGSDDISSVASELDGTIDVTQVYTASFDFAALRSDGSVITWGIGSGSDSSSVASDLDGTVDVLQIFSSYSAFAALRSDGSVVTWGRAFSGGDSSVYSFNGVNYDSSSVASDLDGAIDVLQIFSSQEAFAALRIDGSVVTWGDAALGADSSSVASKLNGTMNVTKIFSTIDSFAALRADGSVVNWGNAAVDSNRVSNELDGTVDVTQIYSTNSSFAALRTDGSVVTWGDSTFGGDSSRVASDLNGTIDVTQIYSNDGAFAALRADGSVITWGSFDYGGAQSAFNVPQNVTQIFSTTNSFAALHTDGSITTWGDENGGGDSGAVHSQLRSGVIDLANIYTDNDTKTSDSLITGASGDSIFFLDGSTETVVLEDGNKLVGGLPNDIDGTNIENFGTDDILFISGVELQQSDLTATKGSAILSLDTDNDDISDTVITLAGDFRLESFVVVGASSSGSYIIYLGNAVPVGEDDNITTLPEGFTTDEDNAFTTTNVLANDNDGDGDALSVTAFDNTGTLGLVLDNGDGTFNYDPNGAFEHLNLGETATDSFGYTVSDGNGDSDTATVTITISGVDDEPVLNLIMGTTGRDILTGTPADDIISSLGGSIDRMTGGAGADIFVFGAETNNGVRERDIIFDYAVGVDSILLEDGASIGSIRQTSSGVAIFFEGDRDAAYVQGDGVLVGNLTFIPEDILFV